MKKIKSYIIQNEEKHCPVWLSGREDLLHAHKHIHIHIYLEISLIDFKHLRTPEFSLDLNQ